MTKSTGNWAAKIGALTKRSPWCLCFNVSLTLKARKYVFALGMVCLSCALHGQDLSGFSEQTLVVVIPSQRKTLAALRQEVANDPTSTRLVRNLTRLESEQRLFEQEILQAMREQYHFSNWGYLSDSALVGRRIDPELWVIQPDGEPQRMDNRNLWFLRKGKASSGAEGLLLCDANLQPLQRPFPGFYKLNRFGAILESFLGRRRHTWKSLDQLVAKMNKKLKAY